MNLQKISLDVNGQLFSHLALQEMSRDAAQLKKYCRSISTILSLIKVHDDRCEVSSG